MPSNFHFLSKNTNNIDVGGVDASVLARSMHYAEVPIPTTEVQGAFSLNIREVGLSQSKTAWRCVSLMARSPNSSKGAW